MALESSFGGVVGATFRDPNANQLKTYVPQFELLTSSVKFLQQ